MDKFQLTSDATNILQKLKIKNPTFLGQGGEGVIFEFENKALKIYNKATKEYLQNIYHFQKMLSKNNFPFSIPQIIEIGSFENTFYTIENKLSGTQMDILIPSLNPHERKLLFRNYYEAIKQINSISFSDYLYGQIIKTQESITTNIWVDFLIKKLRQKVEKTKKFLAKSVKNYDQKVLLFESILKNNIHSDEKKLVHGDYYLNNVLVEKNLSISAILTLVYMLLLGILV